MERHFISTTFNILPMGTSQTTPFYYRHKTIRLCTPLSNLYLHRTSVHVYLPKIKVTDQKGIDSPLDGQGGKIPGVETGSWDSRRTQLGYTPKWFVIYLNCSNKSQNTLCSALLRIPNVWYSGIIIFVDIICYCAYVNHDNRCLL